MLKPVPSQPKPAPTPAPTTAAVDNSLLAPNCAEKLIVASAKSVEKKLYNRDHSVGLCALGVRNELEASGVGQVVDGMGEGAVDDINGLPKHGFVDSGLRDPNTAPAGAIIVFGGPDTAQYFKTGHYGQPPGNWLGHVVIKGDDGFYYTDGRTSYPAIGWTSGPNAKNVQKIRNVIGIFVPGPTLISQYESKCK